MSSSTSVMLFIAIRLVKCSLIAHIFWEALKHRPCCSQTYAWSRGTKYLDHKPTLLYI